MPVHDWSRVDAGLFHHFHQAWIIEICAVLNEGVLPKGYLALVDQVMAAGIPDVIALERSASRDDRSSRGGIAVADAPPKAQFVLEAVDDAYVRRANRIAIRRGFGQIVAVIEILSPGNKSSRHAIEAFVEKAAEVLRSGVSLLLVDLFPPSPRDPQGIHAVIWNEFKDEPFEFSADKPLTAASYAAGEVKTAYVEPLAVGDQLPSLPIFLDAEFYVPAPLESTYATTWRRTPEALREMVAGGDSFESDAS